MEKHVVIINSNGLITESRLLCEMKEYANICIVYNSKFKCETCSIRSDEIRKRELERRRQILEIFNKTNNEVRQYGKL